MRVARLLSAVFEIDAAPGITAEQLADVLGVSLRTVYRDVAALQQAGVPVYGLPGRGGGFRLVGGYRSRSGSLRTTEAAAVLTSLVPGIAEQIGLGDDALRGARKLAAQSLLPAAGLRPDQVLIDPLGWYRSPTPTPHLSTVVSALTRGRVLAISYRRWAEPTIVRRRVQPWGVVAKDGRWYVMARRRGQLRTYRVDQILTARLTEEEFAADPDFDLAAAWTDHVAGFRQWLHVIDVRVTMTRAVLDRIRAEGDPALCAAVVGLDSAGPELAGPESAGPDSAEDDEQFEVVLPFESEERAVAELLRFATGVTVLAPASVRARLARTAAEISERYRRQPG